MCYYISVDGDPGVDMTINLKKSEYDQEIPQSQTADQTTAPLGRGTGLLQ